MYKHTSVYNIYNTKYKWNSYIRTVLVFASVRILPTSSHTGAWNAECAAFFLVCGHASNRKVFFGASIKNVFLGATSMYNYD